MKKNKKKKKRLRGVVRKKRTKIQELVNDIDKLKLVVEDRDETIRYLEERLSNKK